jgi:hypothetical protein
MKGINNRQKMIVRPRESVQKFVLSAGKLKKKTNQRREDVRTKKSDLGRKDPG